MAFRNPVTTLPLDVLTGTLRPDQIPAHSIDADKIAQGAVNGWHIAGGSITADQIAADTITAAELAKGTITAAEIKPGTITETQIAPGSITTPLLAAGAITADRLAADAITSKTITGGSITGAVITGALIQTAATGERWVLSDPSNPGDPGLYGHVPEPKGGYSQPAHIIAGQTVTGGTWDGPNLSIASGKWSGQQAELFLASDTTSSYASLDAGRVLIDQLDFTSRGQYQAVVPLPAPWAQYGKDTGGDWQALTVLRLGRAAATIGGMIKCTADTGTAAVSLADAIPDWARPKYLMGQTTRTSAGTDARLVVFPNGTVQMFTPAVTKANSYAFFSLIYLLPNP